MAEKPVPFTPVDVRQNERKVPDLVPQKGEDARSFAWGNVFFSPDADRREIQSSAIKAVTKHKS